MGFAMFAHCGAKVLKRSAVQNLAGSARKNQTKKTVTLKVLQTPVKGQQFDESKFPGGTQSVLAPYSIHFVHIISSSVLIILSVI